MAYTPDWEPLADALKRVMATGVSENEAKIGLCHAMADRKINVRVRIAASDYGMRGQVFSDGNVRVPPHLMPGDLDWEQSRPIGQWPIGPKPGEHYHWVHGWENWPIDLLELSTVNVTDRLCGGRANHKAQHKAAAGAKTKGVLEAIHQLWPDGIPNGLTAKDRDNAIRDQLSKTGGSVPQDLARAVQRALRRLK